MRARRGSRLLAVLLAGVVATGCAVQAPSELPAVDALAQLYDQISGVWPTTGWWNSANALTALTDYMISSGDRRYVWVLENTYSKKRNAERGNFVNDFTDDTGWWALAWIGAYDLTGDTRYLATARRDVDFMWSNHDDVCGGGLWWTTDHGYKNAISNELFVEAAAELATRTGAAGAGYLDRAVSVWNWFEASGMINNDLLVSDGLDPSNCHTSSGQTWTYNQGVLLGGLVALHDATGDDHYLERARQLADASSKSEHLNVDGVLTEPCESYGCDVNGPSFKGIYVRNLGALNRALDDHPYSDYLIGQATIAYTHDRSDDNQYGMHWGGPLQSISGATQQSAVDLLLAAQPIKHHGAEVTTGSS
ncbi:MAG: glycoside hydrolase family 76 protein [Actinomycetota bacterium]|nr:glycoside hydrolase family 76 protein [Actinomycetota bacterium]